MPGIQESLKQNLNNTITGLLSGIFLPVVVFIIIYFVLSNQITMSNFMQFLMERKIQGHFISISIIPNLLVFFIFIWSNKIKAARGVLLSTFLWAFVILAIRLFG